MIDKILSQDEFTKRLEELIQAVKSNDQQKAEKIYNELLLSYSILESLAWS